MAKVFRFFSDAEQDQRALVEHLEGLLQAAKDGEITNVLVAARGSDNTINIGWSNADVGERQFLAAHIQAELTYSIIEVNLDRLLDGD